MIILHHIPQSRSMRVLWLLNELEVTFGIVAHPLDRSLRAPGFLSLSPAGRVPALEIDGERMFEATAIIEYLCERFPERGLGRTPDDPDRMAWLVWLHFSETVTGSVDILHRGWAAGAGELMRDELARLRVAYDAIEARLSTPLENRDYLLTSGFSACDIAVGQAVYMARHFLEPDDFPELAAWYARITERDSFAEALPAEGAARLFMQERYEVPDG
ncbi:glutathione S-transferase family protein [Lutimaribacter sp. EGI FJ00015]|uniref:Glutathione S-transferase family protein n=1 Tax=Lutimaribacter degradans TaxID=2945989 RepID=A0ACC5ZS30_9RHOB|nr:glutathione S-transferase family protein [Lutimaribacter sp. EGI FJ00013]MCM2560851.1 glutathione S-transferase family protein [Lutimaribacter sp. EGI FJ00013]MCO0612204.1 glutathione S-transferase family protein [Lutimaribacter sp. EGI FJ00015]MCO0634676.1 glutathione S-transferase family protein [Lutimaribacter sp. EGI FJ00014]